MICSPAKGSWTPNSVRRTEGYDYVLAGSREADPPTYAKASVGKPLKLRFVNISKGEGVELTFYNHGVVEYK